MSPADLYDDLVDQYEDYDDGEEELSPEDRASMRKGTAEVQKALGSDVSKVTVAQIQEALWHYYYDVDKSIGYLKRTLVSPTAKPSTKKTPEGKSVDFFFSDQLGIFVRGAGADQGRPVQSDVRPDGSSIFGCPYISGNLLRKSGWPPPMATFGDMPWLNVPQDRLATFIPPHQPRDGLLGGSEGPAKMSKLQSLAAARKKKTDEKREQGIASQAESGMKRLSLSDHNSSCSLATSSNPAKRQKSLEKQLLQPMSCDYNSSDGCPRRRTEKEDPGKDARPAQESGRRDSAARKTFSIRFAGVHQVARTVPDANPSAFARTLLGSAPSCRLARRPDYFAMPYTTSPVFLAAAFAVPSPDDIVLSAQAKGSTLRGPHDELILMPDPAGKKTLTALKATKKTPTEDSKRHTELSNDVSGLKINDAPPPKSKGLDVIKEFETSKVKKSISFVVVGHVDAGKSTLIGRLLLELKLVEQRTVDRYRRQAEKAGKQSFSLAWVMDQGSEERDRGVTIDIATNHFETPTTKFTILDAPGHRDFVPNMIAGASQADLAILVIDANTGAFERGLKGQTREHVLLLRSLSVQRLIVAVNKLDMVGWSKERFNEISEKVKGFLTGLGFQGKHVSFIPISGLNGDNIAGKIESSVASWYTGANLMELLEAAGQSTTRALRKAFRMPISEVFRSPQWTTTLGGRIDSGTIQIGDSIVLQPSGESAYVKSIMVDTNSQDWAVAGQSVSMALGNVDAIHIRVGDIVCDAKDPIKCGETFIMKVMAFDHVMPMPVDLHRGRLHVPGQIQSISALLDKTTGEVVKKKPKVVQPRGVARMLIRLNGKVALEAGHRVVIRSGGETIAAGLLE